MDVTHEYTRQNIPALPSSVHDGSMPSQAGGRPIPFFSNTPVYLKEQSERLGRPVYKTVEMIQIVVPGDNSLAPTRKVTREHRERFPEHYEAFKRQEEIAETGTPIDHWGVLTQDQRYSFKHMKIFTVEHIAGLSDSQLQQVGMGARILKEKAIAFLEAQKTGAVPERLVSENSALRKQVEMLAKQVAELVVRLETSTKEAGQDVSALADPVAVAKETIRSTVTTDAGGLVDVPVNYKSLSFTKLRELAAQISVAPVMNKDEAFATIEEYLGKRAAAA